MLERTRLHQPDALPDIDEIKAERARRSLQWFVRYFWDVLEPGTELIWSWHIEAICEHLEAVTNGEILRLLINIPPGHMKSLLVSVFWPAWMWIRRPEWRALFSSYAMELAIRDSVKCRDLLKSQRYQEWFNPDWSFKDDTDAKAFYQNTRYGFRVAMSVGGKGTGWRGDVIVTDDPLNAEDAHSEAALEQHVRWWDKTMSSRLNDQRVGARVIIMQRLHQNDLSGHVLAKGGYEHLCLPTKFEIKRKCVTKIWNDPRTKEGELLCPILFNRAVVSQAELDLGPDGFAGQHQQNPEPTEGGILKRVWWQYYNVRPQFFSEVIQTWDTTYKDTKKADFVCGQVWGRKGADIYLLDQIHARLDFDGAVDAFKAITARWPGARAKYIEDAANGPAIISSLKRKIPGIQAVTPCGSKVARAYAAQPFLAAGNVHIPDEQLSKLMADHWRRIAQLPNSWLREEFVVDDWVERGISQAAMFPNGTNDDWVDAFTQGVLKMLISRSRGGQYNTHDLDKPPVHEFATIPD